jgi:DNA-binding MarR family transcriptional regulator
MTPAPGRSDGGPALADPPPAGHSPVAPAVRLSRAFGSVLGAERRLRARDQRGDVPMTYAHLRALLLLLDEREATPSALARAAELNPASVTAMIDQLEKRRLVTRRRDEHDRRVFRISLTELGREETLARRRNWYGLITEAVADFSPADLEVACAVFDRLATAIDTIRPADPDSHLVRGTGSPPA